MTVDSPEAARLPEVRSEPPAPAFSATPVLAAPAVIDTPSACEVPEAFTTSVGLVEPFGPTARADAATLVTVKPPPPPATFTPPDEALPMNMPPPPLELIDKLEFVPLSITEIVVGPPVAPPLIWRPDT